MKINNVYEPDNPRIFFYKHPKHKWMGVLGAGAVAPAAIQPRRLAAKGGISPGRTAQNEKPSEASFELRPDISMPRCGTMGERRLSKFRFAELLVLERWNRRRKCKIRRT